MGTNRGDSGTMKILTGIAAALALTLAFAAGPASAKQVYTYQYSGVYYDGTGSEAGQFNTPFGGLAYDEQQEQLIVGRAQSEGKISKFTKTGTPAKFSALNGGTGGDTITLGTGFGHGVAEDASIGIDNSGGPNTGNVYQHGGGFGGGGFHAFLPSGAPIPAFEDIDINFSCGVGVGPNGEIWRGGSKEGIGALVEVNIDGTLNPNEAYMGLFGGPDSPCHPVLDSQGNFYVWNSPGGFERFLTKFPPKPVQSRLGPPEREELYRLNGFGFPGQMAVDMSNDDLFAVENAFSGPIGQYDSKGGKLGTFGGAEGPYLGIANGVGGIAVDPVTHDVWVANGRSYSGIRRVEKFSRVGPITVPTTDTAGVTRPEGPAKATLHGVLNPDGIATTECYFKWSTSQNLFESGNVAQCEEGKVHAGSGNISVTAKISGLTKGTRYWYRLFSQNANNRLSDGGPEKFRAQNKPIIGTIFPDAVNTDGVRLTADIDPNGGPTFYHWEYGPTTSYGSSSPTTRLARRDAEDLEQLPSSIVDPYKVQNLIIGLTPGSDYHFKLVVENDEGISESEDFEFTTYVPDPGIDNCPNSLVRQQTTAALLADCRAYELASTSNGGGYDVVSDVVPNQEPLVTSPWADGRLLYSMDAGVIPGTEGNPTNLGRDPYVAVRTETGWVTKYVGLPADGLSDNGSYGSPLLGTDASLDTFAFGGKDICDPCFPDGSTNVPLRLPNGTLVKGMAGTINPSADPVGEVRKPLSDDGSHFYFGSEPDFETVGEPGSIYDRNLSTGTTQVVSTMPNGTTMTGEVAQLDATPDGSRVLIGKKVGEDPQGNPLYDLYMHRGSNPNSIEVANTAPGAQFSGMTNDGSMVFFTTADPLSGDIDTSADLYRADVGSSSATIARVSTGAGTGNTDGCSPPGLPNSWNSAGGDGKCGVLAFAGGAGLAEDDGSIYFLSPETLDGGGDTDQANIFFAKPGQAPSFVATLDTSAGKPGPSAPTHPVANANFGGSFENPVSVGVDQSNGDVYVANSGAKKVSRFTAAGAPKNFTTGPGAGTNSLPSLEWPEIGAGQVAIDNSGGVANGDIYVVSQNPSFESKLSVYSPTGTLLTTLTGTGTPGGSFGFVCGVAVDQANGNVYLGDYFGNVWRYTPSANPVTEANYSGGINSGSFGSCGVAVAAGKIYVAYEGDFIIRFPTSAFAMGPPPFPAGFKEMGSGKGVATDPGNGNVFVTQGNKVAVYDDDEAATPLETFGTGSVSNAYAIAMRSSNQHVFVASHGNRVVEFGLETPPYTPLNHRAIVNAVKQPGTHDYGDFQVSGNGDYAIFDSTIPLTGHPTFKHSEVYLYNVGADALECPSCAPTKAAATSDTFLPRYGLGLTEDGRAFFTSKESFVLRDSNGRKDAYQWDDGVVQLISRGLGAEDSGILGVSADGVDAFFFTRDKLVHNDGNGNAVKIYTAREGGGFAFDPTTQPCAASDECHGAGTQPPPPPDINSLSPAPTVTPKKATTCRKGFVKRGGKCKKKKKKKRSQKSSRAHG